MSNLVVNGDFTNNLTAWSVAGLPAPAIDSTIFYPTSPPNSLGMGTILVGVAQSATQTVNGFIVGQQYRLIYAIQSTGLSAANLFSASVGGTVVSQINLLNIVGQGWAVQVTPPFTATSTSMQLQFNRALSVNVGGRVNIDTVSIIPAALICFSGSSLVRIQDKATGEEKEIPAREVSPTKHLVYSFNSKIFVPLSLNAKCSITTTFLKISKDSIAPGEPHTDLLITPGHKVKVNGEIIRAKDVPGVRRVTVEPEHVYTFVAHYEDLVCINGMQVKTWADDAWAKFIKERGIVCEYIE